MNTATKAMQFEDIKFAKPNKKLSLHKELKVATDGVFKPYRTSTIIWFVVRRHRFGLTAVVCVASCALNVLLVVR